MVGLGITPNPDTILQEVRALQSNYSAQYSLYGSTAEILQTKSGTDQFHGTTFEYLRKDALDARIFFSPTSPCQAIWKCNFGLSRQAIQNVTIGYMCTCVICVIQQSYRLRS